jgi:uncharacterized protein YbcI
MGADMRAPNDQGKMLLAVTNAIVSLHREHYGRGATRGRTIMQGNYLVCFLEDIYTKAERTLIGGGRLHEVIQARNAFQDTMAGPFRETVEELTGRRVIGFLSQVGTDPDIGVEAFWLAPDGDGQ